MGQDASRSLSESESILPQRQMNRSNRRTSKFSRRPKEFSGPQIKLEDIVVTGKVSSDEKSSYGAVLQGYCYGCVVAIKVLRGDSVNRDLLEGFKEEVKIMSEITHPNVCLFLGACFDESAQVMLITELLEGDLASLLESPYGRSASLFRRVAMARDICQGMAWLHSIKIAHLDLKPANILYDSNYRLKVADFGLARILNDDGYIPGSCGGTPLYSAPEVLRRDDFTDKADVYSFALILWFILTGKEPYETYSEWDTFFRAIVDDNVRPPVPQRCPRKLGRLLTVSWDREAARRPAFTEIIPALEVVLLEAAVPDPHARRFWKEHFLSSKNYGPATLKKLQTQVSWAQFYEALAPAFGLPVGDNATQPAMVSSTKLTDNSPLREFRTATQERLDEYARTSVIARQRVDEEDQRRRCLIGAECMRSLLVMPGSDGGGGGGIGSGGGDGDTAATLPSASGGLVTVEQFGFMVEVFGPANGDPNKIMRRVQAVLSAPWFHGTMTSADAFLVLKDQRPGTFLVRLSSSQKSFVVSVVVSREVGVAAAARLPGKTSPPTSARMARAPMTAVADMPRYGSPATNGLLQEMVAADDEAQGMSNGKHADGGSAQAKGGRRRSAVNTEQLRMLLVDDLNAVVHFRVPRDTVDGFHYVGSDRFFSSIVRLVDQSPLLAYPCPAPRNRFAYLFTPTNAIHFGFVADVDEVNPLAPVWLQASSVDEDDDLDEDEEGERGIKGKGNVRNSARKRDNSARRGKLARGERAAQVGPGARGSGSRDGSKFMARQMSMVELPSMRLAHSSVMSATAHFSERERDQKKIRRRRSGRLDGSSSTTGGDEKKRGSRATSGMPLISPTGSASSAGERGGERGYVPPD